MKVYWGGPLFTQAERLWNRRCVAALRAMGYAVVLPQDEAVPFVKAGSIDARRIAEHCYRQSVDCEIMVVVLDGTDVDSGASVEAGLRIGHQRALGAGGKTIGVRTDFRRSEDRHLNAMFRLLDAQIYLPSFKNEDPEALCQKIHKTILRLNSKRVKTKRTR